MTLHSSQLGHGGHRDDRRRRLLAEDRSASFTPSDPNAPEGCSELPATHKFENYGDAEFLEAQLRLTDLVPRRLLALVLLPMLGVAAIAGLITLYVTVPELLHTPGCRPATASLGQPGSLGNWFSSLLLLVASLLAIITFTVRRHKADDYRGRYRIWLWAAAFWFLMASDAAASLHEGVRQSMVSLTHMRIVGNGSIWWLAPGLLFYGTIVTRLLIDMWSCRLSTAAMSLSAIAYTAALAAFFHIVRVPMEHAEPVFLYGSLLAGHLFLAWSMALHARYVLLDAEGRLPRRTQKPKAAKRRIIKSKAKAAAFAGGDTAVAEGSDRAEAETEDGTDKWIAIDPPHGEGTSPKPPVLKRMNTGATSTVPSVAQKSAAPLTGAPPPASGQDDRKLSKFDRKALKKKLLEDRLKAEQRKAANW